MCKNHSAWLTKLNNFPIPLRSFNYSYHGLLLGPDHRLVVALPPDQFSSLYVSQRKPMLLTGKDPQKF